MRIQGSYFLIRSILNMIVGVLRMIHTMFIVSGMAMDCIHGPMESERKQNFVKVSSTGPVK